MSPLPPAAPDPAPSPDPIPITGQGYLPDSVLHDVLSAVDQLGISHNFKEVSDRLLAVLGEAFHATSAFIYAFLPGAAGQGDRLGIYAEWPAAPGARLLPDWLDDPVLFAALAAGQPYFTRAFPTAAAPAALVFFPLRLNGKYWGGIGFEDSSSGKIWTPAENAMLSAAVATVCHAIERTLRPAAPGADARLVQESEQRVFAEAISHTANILNQSHDLNEVLELIMDHIGTVVPHDVANIMLVTGDTAQITATRGYDKLGVEKAVLLAQRRKIEQVPNLRRMAETGLGIVVSDTHASPDWVEFKSSAWIHSYVSAPICYKGAVIGFLNLNSELPGFFTAKMANRLQAFADQAGLAIYNAKLVHELRSSHHALKEAYDNTLLGWSKALELRDNETEGHTLRVVGKTLQLAIMFGIREPDLTYIRFGAMLHDIGKIAIPDSILMKEGPLTEEEWRIMRQHPDFARQILSPIPYLVPAIDIPYAHHERWDGTGYPRGLKGLEIPFSARIFMVVDVYDGLRSDRRYRSGWDDAKVIQYIRSQSGLHFDPEVVDAFMKMDLHS